MAHRPSYLFHGYSLTSVLSSQSRVPAWLIQGLVAPGSRATLLSLKYMGTEQAFLEICPMSYTPPWTSSGFPSLRGAKEAYTTNSDKAPKETLTILEMNHAISVLKYC